MEIPINTLKEIKQYLLIDSEVERGCLVTNDFKIIPFTNTAKYPIAKIEMGIDAFNIMVDLVSEGNLFGWAHSHPKWSPYPSITDLTMHPLAITMIIYSVPEDRFGIYPHEEVQRLTAQCSAIPNDPTSWKPNITELLHKKELTRV